MDLVLCLSDMLQMAKRSSMTSGGLSSVLTAYDQCIISLAIGYDVSWIHYSILYGIMINPSVLDVPFTNVSTSVEHV